MNLKVARPVGRVRLPDDFAKRVIGRVEQIERRRSIRRRARATTAVLVVALLAGFSWHYPSTSSERLSIAQPSPAGAGFASVTLRVPEPVYGLGQEQPVMDLLRPDGYMMTNFVNSSGESGWHSYDSWWGSSS